MPTLEETKKYTVQDYMTWNDDKRWELIEGVVYDMTPAPSPRHQEIHRNMTRILDNALRGKPGVLYYAPIDVVLSENDVVQPDHLVVCDRSKITEKNIQGAPDLIIEVLSPATAKKDRGEKKDLYERHGVKEYLLVDPEGQYVERFLLGPDGRYSRGQVFGARETLSLQTLDDLQVPLWEVFGVEPPDAAQA